VFDDECALGISWWKNDLNRLLEKDSAERGGGLVG
jgi:hypothetical protein